MVHHPLQLGQKWSVHAINPLPKAPSTSVRSRLGPSQRGQPLGWDLGRGAVSRSVLNLPPICHPLTLVEVPGGDCSCSQSLASSFLPGLGLRIQYPSPFTGGTCGCPSPAACPTRPQHLIHTFPCKPVRNTAPPTWSFCMFLQPPHGVCQEHQGRLRMTAAASVTVPRTRPSWRSNRTRTWPDSTVLPPCHCPLTAERASAPGWPG